MTRFILLLMSLSIVLAISNTHAAAINGKALYSANCVADAAALVVYVRGLVQPQVPAKHAG